MRSDSVRMAHRTTAGVSTGENRNARLSAKGNADMVAKGQARSGEHRDERGQHVQTLGFAATLSAMSSPRRTEVDHVADGALRMDRASSRKETLSTRDRMAGPYPITHSSAPPETQRGLSRDRSPQFRTKPSHSGRRQGPKQAIRTRGGPSPDYSLPTSISIENRLKIQTSRVVPDYRALSSMPPAAMGRIERHSPRDTRDTLQDTAAAAVASSNVCNNVNKDSLVDNAMQNNLSACVNDDDTCTVKIRGPISAGVSSDSRRVSRAHSSRTPAVASPFSLMRQEFEEASLGCASSVSASQRSNSIQTRDSLNSVTFWPKTHSSQLRDVVHTVDDVEDPVKEFTGLEGSPSSTYSRVPSEVSDNLSSSLSRYFGLSFGRRKSKTEGTCSPMSSDEPSTATSSTKRKKKLPKMVRRLGKAINKRILHSDETKTANLKSFLRSVLSLQSCSVDAVWSPEKRFSSGKSLSSDNTSDTCSSIDMEEIKATNPQLYSTILETVASWCDGPTAEPDDHSEALSSRTFSSISFCEKNDGGSQDLSTFERRTSLEEEEAFLTEVIQGRISPSSTASDSPRKDKQEETMTMPSLDEAESKDDMVEAVCDVSKEESPVPVSESPSALKDKSVSLAASFLHLTDSESDDEMEIKEKGNDFLHLTSSELESMELNGMKEVLQMQGIWLFNWNRCAEIKNLSEEWKDCACLKKYTDGAEGVELTVEDGVVKCFCYRSSSDTKSEIAEHVFLEDVPPPCTPTTINLRGTLTSMGLRTTQGCEFPEDNSRREELVWIERDGLCIQISSELASGERNVSRVYLRRCCLGSDASLS